MIFHLIVDLHFNPSNRKCTKDTFKGSLFGCQENVSNTTLTIVCTINVSIDCDCFDVSSPNERKNIHKIKSSQWDAWFVFCFLKKIVCKDDEIPAFSAMMKMGLNCLHLTNWLRERNIFGLVWSPCVKICLT